MTRLFVYGTLKRGGKWHHYLAGQTFLAEARTQPGFTLYSLDGYPGLVASTEDKEGVSGELWAVDPSCLRKLDEFEGLHEGLYRRESIPLASPQSAADTYVYARSITSRPKLGAVWNETDC